jgi:hypothetical protein
MVAKLSAQEDDRNASVPHFVLRSVVLQLWGGDDLDHRLDRPGLKPPRSCMSVSVRRSTPCTCTRAGIAGAASRYSCW